MRMPVILTQAIDQVHKRVSETVVPGKALPADEAADQAAARETLGKMSKLKREIEM